MSYSVAFSPEALAQLDALEDYIGTHANPQTAERFVDALINFCESLVVFPLRGTRREDLLPNLRTTHFRHSTTIAFRVHTPSRTVMILGVFYGGQDYATLLQREVD